jgi:hypothetical protein
MDIPETDGVHRVTWNLRVTQPAQAGGRGGGGGGGGGGGRGAGGPLACAPISSGAGANAAAQPPAGGPGGPGGGFGGRGGGAPMVAFGRYTATLGRLNGDQVTAVGKPQSFQVVPLPAKNW